VPSIALSPDGKLIASAGFDGKVQIWDAATGNMLRTIITNATVLSVVLILFLFGGKVIHNFAMAMVFGALVGTYSTIAVATPFVYEWALRISGRGSAAAPAPVRAAKKGGQ